MYSISSIKSPQQRFISGKLFKFFPHYLMNLAVIHVNRITPKE